MVDVGNNFGKISLCPLGCLARDDQEHIFQCEKIITDPAVTKKFKYEDIFSEKVTKFTNAANISEKLSLILI